MKNQICGLLDFLCLRDRRYLWIILGPLLPSPFLFIKGTVEMYRCAWVSVWMAVYWVTEPVPVAVTAFIPLLFFPILSISSSKDTSEAYFNDTLFLLISSIMFATGLEKYQIHRKVALKFLIFVGNSPKILLLGFMLITAFISMWISNTATCAMMTPLGIAVLDQIEKGIKEKYLPNEQLIAGNNEEEDFGDIPLETKEVIEDPNSAIADRININIDILGYIMGLFKEDKIPEEGVVSSARMREYDRLMEEYKSYSTGLLLGIAYASSLGGTATLIGTGPNIILASQIKILFPNAPGLSFGKWFIMGTPLAYFVIFITWSVIVLKYARKTSFPMNLTVLQTYYDDIGPINFAQSVIIIDFLLMVSLWFTKTGFDGKSGGWSELFPVGQPSESTVCILGVFILFLIPSGYRKPAIFQNDVIVELPWDIVLLFSGGFGLAHGIQKSGLSAAISDQLQFVQHLDTYITLVVVCFLVVVMTEFTSNSSTITVFCPLLAALAVGIKQDPLLFLIPATLSSTYSFMLPVATPGNAIVFASGKMRVLDMITTGGFINLVGLFVVPACMLLFAPVFDITPGVLPDWAKPA